MYRILLFATALAFTSGVARAEATEKTAEALHVVGGMTMIGGAVVVGLGAYDLATGRAFDDGLERR